MKLDLLTNATVVDDSNMFVSQKSKENKSYSNSNEDDEESDEPDYDEHNSRYNVKKKTRSRLLTNN